MANAFNPEVGHWVSYLSPFVTEQKDIRWRAVKITAVNSPTSLVLAYVEDDGTRVPVNGGAPVLRRTSPTQTNVWRPY